MNKLKLWKLHVAQFGDRDERGLQNWSQIFPIHVFISPLQCDFATPLLHLLK